MYSNYSYLGSRCNDVLNFTYPQDEVECDTFDLNNMLRRFVQRFSVINRKQDYLCYRGYPCVVFSNKQLRSHITQAGRCPEATIRAARIRKNCKFMLIYHITSAKYECWKGGVRSSQGLFHRDEERYTGNLAIITGI